MDRAEDTQYDNDSIGAAIEQCFRAIHEALGALNAMAEMQNRALSALREETEELKRVISRL